MKDHGWQTVFLLASIFFLTLRGNLATPGQQKVPEYKDTVVAREISSLAALNCGRNCKTDGNLDHPTLLKNGSGDPATGSTSVGHHNGGRHDREIPKERPLPEGSPTNTSSVSQRSADDPTFRKLRLLQESGRPFGSHPLPPLEAFTTDGDAHWVGYFCEEAVAAVQQTETGTMVRCVVQEVMENWEQCAARQYLGSVMPLIPMPLSSMMHLITLCGILNSPSFMVHEGITTVPDPFNSWWLGPTTSALVGILPGTLWCGKRDRATYYHQLGQRAQLDDCCRAHDHCPIKVLPLATRYGVTNFGFATKSHCVCDLEFFRCLKATKDSLATTVGQLYFNLLKMQCLNTVSPAPQGPGYPAPTGTYSSQPLETIPEVEGRHDPQQEPSGRTLKEEEAASGSRLECSYRDVDGGCRMWHMNPKGFTVRYVVQSLNLRF